MPQTLALDLATVTSVTTALANVATTSVVFITYASNSQTLITPAFVNRCHIAQPD
jgi:hypothetical protein